MSSLQEKLKETTDFIKKKGVSDVEFGLILGSGLGDRRVAYSLASLAGVGGRGHAACVQPAIGSGTGSARRGLRGSFGGSLHVVSTGLLSQPPAHVTLYL